jgi:hypothetical protein
LSDWHFLAQDRKALSIGMEEKATEDVITEIEILCLSDCIFLFSLWKEKSYKKKCSVAITAALYKVLLT